MKVAGLFSGVGGIELGFEQAGFEPVWSNEIDRHAAITFRENFSHQLFEGDIHRVEGDEVPEIDVLVGGFPCQAFSVAGYRKGFEDERGEIFFQMARIIREKRPRVIFIENVKNLVSHDGGNTFKVIQETVASFGYQIHTAVLNGVDYGNIPQNRERIYIIGFRDSKDFDNFRGVEPIPLTTTIADIVDFDEKVADKFYYTPEKTTFYDELAATVKRPDTLYQWRRVYVRENKSNVCPTLTANMGTGGHNVPIALTKHGIRKLTPKECFRFQGFPESFTLPAIAQSHLYKQAGNSVVVPVIDRLAQEIRRAVERTDSEGEKHE